MTIDPLSTSASALSLLERLLRLFRLRRGPDDAAADSKRRFPRRPRFVVQAVPVMASIDVSVQPPKVSIELRLVAFGKKPARVSELTVGRLALGALALDGIRLNQPAEVEPGSAVQVFCERALVDTEAMHIAATYGRDPWQGGLNYSGTARVGGKDVPVGPEHGQVVWIRVHRGAV